MLLVHALSLCLLVAFRNCACFRVASIGSMPPTLRSSKAITGGTRNSTPSVSRKASLQAEDQPRRSHQGFKETSVLDAVSLTDGLRLQHPTPLRDGDRSVEGLAADDVVIIPWMGFGTYRLGKQQAFQAVVNALEEGYRSIDTAFIYGGQTTEKLVGEAIQHVLSIGTGGISSREELFVTTKHWRNFHGYDPTLECLRLSLKSLQLDYVDLWLMHWPGPAYNTMNRKTELVQKDPWHYSKTSANEMAALRAETWRAMEDAYRQGKSRAIGVSNCSPAHLEALKQTATLWPPAVNQVEIHPLHPQDELLEYCRREGIAVQAYASLGGQDAGKKVFTQLLGKVSTQPDLHTEPLSQGEKAAKRKKRQKLEMPSSLLDAPPIRRLAAELEATPAQTLLAWSLFRGCIQIPKTVSRERLRENAAALHITQRMTLEQIDHLRDQLRAMVERNNPDCTDLEKLTRLCWVRDPLRHLDFD